MRKRQVYTFVSLHTAVSQILAYQFKLKMSQLLSLQLFQGTSLYTILSLLSLLRTKK